MKNLFLVLSVALVAASCGKNGSHSAPSKSQEEKDRIQDSIQNGHIPSRQEVKSSNIQFDNACEKFRKTIPKDWAQGLVEVPENPNDPSSPLISVFYYGKIKKGVTPVVFFNGGPTYDSHSSFVALTKSKPAKDPKGYTSFIFIDQRGNGCSDYYPQGDSDDILTRLVNYGTKGIVADAEAVRKKLLGDQKWIAFGQSYGSFIVHRYAIQSPEGLKAGFGHGSAITDDGYMRSFNRVKSQARVREEYLKVYPSDRHNLEVLGKKLNRNVCFKDSKTSMEVCGFELFSLLPEYLAFKDSWRSTHTWIRDLVRGDELDFQVLGEYAATFYFSEYSDSGAKVYNSKTMADKVITWSDRGQAPLNLHNCKSFQRDLLNMGIDISEDITTECAWAVQLDDDYVDTQDRFKFLPRDLMQVNSLYTSLYYNHLNFYLYSGELDQTVPKENFEQEVAAASSLPNFHYTHFMNSGHEGFRSENQVWQDLIKEINQK